ncbi:Pycsar system effector family protein [Streptomyces sp. MS2.AVA.5]|uniref:Pycsar system effector family protein n=1 Tax=Streptomyces achmelvichensis TaxID=3134111 RepID=A0ACC6PM87_9ACTN
MTTTQESTNYERAAGLRQRAHEALDGRDPDVGWSVKDRSAVSAGHAVLAAATQLADLSDRLVAVDIDLSRIANAAEARVERLAETDHTEPELQVVRGEISRTDTKSSILLASVAIIAGPLAEKAETLLHQPWPITAVGVVAAVFAGLATWLLLNVVLPRLHGNSNANFLHYARCSPEELAEALGAKADRRSELAALSAIAEAKFRQLARAGVLLKISGLLFAATAALAVAF